MRADAIHLLTCSRCAWLMSYSFVGEHMSTTAVPSWIGSDCTRANCIPGSQAKSEHSSELPQFFFSYSSLLLQASSLFDSHACICSKQAAIILAKISFQIWELIILWAKILQRRSLNTFHVKSFSVHVWLEQLGKCLPSDTVCISSAGSGGMSLILIKACSSSGWVKIVAQIFIAWTFLLYVIFCNNLSKDITAKVGFIFS